MNSATNIQLRMNSASKINKAMGRQPNLDNFSSEVLTPSAAIETTKHQPDKSVRVLTATGGSATVLFKIANAINTSRNTGVTCVNETFAPGLAAARLLRKIMAMATTTGMSMATRNIFVSVAKSATSGEMI